MKQIGNSRFIRYMLIAACAFVSPFANALISVVASVWADKDQDRASLLLNQRIETLIARSLSPDPIFKEDDYRAEIVKAQQELYYQAEHINKLRFLSFRHDALDRQIEATIYSGVYKNKIAKIRQRKELSDQLYELDVKEIKVHFDALARKNSGDACDIEEQESIKLQKLKIRYGKMTEYPSIGPMRMTIVAR